MKPQLVDKKILKKLIMKNTTKSTSKFNIKFDMFEKIKFGDYWFLFIIIPLVLIFLYLKYKETKEKKQDSMTNTVNKKKEERLADSEGYEMDYYSMLPRIMPVTANHPSLT